MDIINKTKIIYKKTTKKKVILKAQIKEIIELLQDTEIFLQEFKLNCQFSSSIVAEVTDIIGLKYKKLFI